MRLTGLNSTYTVTSTTNAMITKNTTSPANITNIYVGSGNTAGAFFNGYIFEIIVFGDALNSSQVQMVENYLYKKWGIF
jgi:hypothetical protein